MARMLDTKEYLDAVCALLRQGERNVAVPVTGSSMIPFLHNGDMVYLEAPKRKLKRGDIVLYTRENGQYVLHRIWRLCRDGGVAVVGDAQQETEYLPRRECIHGLVTSVRHQGRILTPSSLRWQIYRRVWLWLRPVRYRLLALRSKQR